jgi:D-alanine--poly(phosphoribitol) ligase subunit 1
MKLDYRTNQLIEKDRNTNKAFVITPTQTISWEEASRISEKLQQIFSLYQLTKGHPVIVYGHKEAFYTVAMMSCILAEMPFVPIDTIYPADRISYIKNATESAVVINCTNSPTPFENVIEINSKIEHKIIGALPSTFVNYYIPGNPIIYMMFTSGSTGTPKGVEITRRNVIAFSDWTTGPDYGYTENTNLMNQAIFSFDLSMYDFVPFLSLGATLVCTPKELCENRTLLFDYLHQHKVNAWASTPSYAYYNLYDEDFNQDKLPYLTSFVLIGERLPATTAIKLKERFESAKVINAYGPTEATVATSMIELDKSIFEKYAEVPIGYAMPNCDLVIIDENNNEIENGSGEILICGPHVANGYFKNPALTAEKFITFNNKPAYKTGDIGHFQDGILFTTGRSDEQIKFNGFRIELNEISNCIGALKHIVNHAETIALRRNGEVKKLVSFIQLCENVNYTKEIELEIYEHCKIKMPHYMVPAELKLIDNFPYNNNLKVDKKKLEDIYLKK